MIQLKERGEPGNEAINVHETVSIVTDSYIYLFRCCEITVKLVLQNGRKHVNLSCAYVIEAVDIMFPLYILTS